MKITAPRRRKLAMLGSGVLAFGILVCILFFNPHDLLTKRSNSFSFDRFDELTTRQSLEDAIELLGEPIAIKDTQVCESCKLYFFMGEYPGWVFGGTECWLIVDSRGQIVDKVRIVEPLLAPTENERESPS